MHEEPVAQNEVSLREYLDLLRRRKAIIISTFVAALFIGVAAILISRPVFRSTGRLLVQPHIVVANASENVPEEKLTGLFDKFVRLDDKLTRTTGGTGLGLFITKGLVELMQGRIWLESDNNEFRVNFTVPCSDF